MTNNEEFNPKGPSAELNGRKMTLSSSSDTRGMFLAVFNLARRALSVDESYAACRFSLSLFLVVRLV
jgi:hypothetical protein